MQVFEIEIERTELEDDDDAWEMLDNLQSFIMQKNDGILMTGDNEFYDEELKKIYKL